MKQEDRDAIGNLYIRNIIKEGKYMGKLEPRQPPPEGSQYIKTKQGYFLTLDDLNEEFKDHLDPKFGRLLNFVAIWTQPFGPDSKIGKIVPITGTNDPIMRKIPAGSSGAWFLTDKGYIWTVFGGGDESDYMVNIEKFKNDSVYQDYLNAINSNS
jgi:hypothetical protein